MKKITLLAALFMVAISYGQIKTLKGNSFLTSGCGAGGKAAVSYPEGFSGATSGYEGSSGTANWEINPSLDDNNKIWIQGEIVFENVIPTDTPISDIISIPSGGDYILTAYAHNATDNTLSSCSFNANQKNKIRFNLEYTGTYVNGSPQTVDITTTDIGGSSPIAQTIVVTVTPNEALSIEKLKKYGFSFAPNPTTNYINLSAAKNISSIEVYNVLGQKSLSTKVDAARKTLDISNLSSGIYIMKVAIDEAVGSYKIIKQ